MKTIAKSLLFGATLLAVSSTAFAAGPKTPPAWVMLLGQGDQIVTLSPERAAYVDAAINPQGENLAQAQ